MEINDEVRDFSGEGKEGKEGVREGRKGREGGKPKYLVVVMDKLHLWPLEREKKKRDREKKRERERRSWYGVIFSVVIAGVI